MELLKDYNCDILYHSGNVNKVVDMRSRKSTVTQMMIKEWTLLKGANDSDFKFEVRHLSSLLATLKIELAVQARIKALQTLNPTIQKILQKDAYNKKPHFWVVKDGTLRFRRELCVPDNVELKDEIFSETHHSNYSIHQGSTKMYQNLRQYY